MPIYEYDCLDCGQPLEVFQHTTEKPLEVCPKCQGLLKKRISLSSFILKGTGWYKTDYAAISSTSTGTKPSIEPTSEKTNGKEGNGHKKEENASDKTPKSPFKLKG
jgi:putative FmdB family regulatory protein